MNNSASEKQKRRFSYSIPEMTVRLLHIAAPVKSKLAVSTLASVVGNLSQMGLMAFGAMLLLNCTGKLAGSAVVYGILMSVSALLIVICRYTEGVVSHAGAYCLLAHMRVHLFETLRRLAPACLMDREKGDTINIAVSDIETVEFFFAHTIGPMFTVILLPCLTLIIAFCVNPLFASVLLPVYLIVSLIFPLTAVWAGRPVGLRYRKSLGKLKSTILESVYGLRDIQIFGCADERLRLAREENEKVNKAAHLLTLHRQTVSSAPTFFIYLARIAIIAVASWLAARGTDNPAGTIILSFAATASFSSTQSLTMVISSLLETYAAAERIFILEDTEPEIVEPTEPKDPGTVREIVFDHVTFSYPGRSEKILDDFCLTVGNAEKLGIVGESGAGKSTILRLLMRFWNPSAGSILINGIPVNEISSSVLRSRIAMLEQDTFLFDCSIAENIALGRPDASQDEIISAAKRAGVHDFIMTLPDKYATEMGQMGARLSGGERQRIGIARTLIMDPDVIIMDEPTSSLDVLHEKELLKTLETACVGKVLIIVSHRPSTLTGCSRTVKLKDSAAS